MGTQRIHISLYFTVIAIDTIVVFWRKQNEEHHAKCIQVTVKSPVRVQVWGAISSRCLSLPRKMNGNMDSAKYQCDIIHDIEMLCEFIVFQKSDISLYMISRYAITLKVLEHSKNVKQYPF